MDEDSWSYRCVLYGHLAVWAPVLSAWLGLQDDAWSIGMFLCRTLFNCFLLGPVAYLAATTILWHPTGDRTYLPAVVVLELGMGMFVWCLPLGDGVRHLASTGLRVPLGEGWAMVFVLLWAVLGIGCVLLAALLQHGRSAAGST